MKGRGAIRAALFACALGVAGTAHASDEKRTPPDYDGKPDKTTPGDVLLWIPRVVFSPVYFVSEYVIRRPLGAAITWAEQANLPAALYDFFAFGPDHKAGFAPIAFYDFGFNPSVGLYLFWDDAFFKGNDLRWHGTIWNDDWLASVLTERIHFGPDRDLTFDFRAIRRPDYTFFGVGPRTLQRDRSRYSEDLIEGSSTFEIRPWRSSLFSTSVGVRSTHFGRGYHGRDPSTELAVTEGRFALPDGFSSGYTAEYNRMLLALDSRRPRPEPGSGLRVEVRGEQGSDLRHAGGATWIRYGATVGAFHDLGGPGRVVSLSVGADFADPTSNAPVPFTELATLGGTDTMRGFWPGRLVDRSSAVATARYRWPIWAWLDGAMEVAVGNVFGEHLRAFDPALLRLTSAIGIGTVGAPDSSVELLVGVGTETFEHGAEVDSLRVLFGTNRGF